MTNTEKYLIPLRFVKMLVLQIVLLLLFYQLCRVIYYLVNLQHFQSVTCSDLSLLFSGSLRFDISAILYLNVVYIAMFLIPLNIRFNALYRKAGKLVFLLVNSLALWSNIIDAAYYPFTLRRTNASLFKEFSNDTNLFLSIGDFVAFYWYILLIAIAVVYLLYKTYTLIPFPKKERGTTFSSVLIQVLILPILGIIWLGFARGSFVPSDRPINISIAGQYVKGSDQIPLVINTPISIMTTWGNIKIPEVNYFSSFEEVEHYYNPVQHYPDSVVNKKNVVIIVVESLSKEFIHSLNTNIPNHIGYTPFLDSLIAQSLTFEHSYANGKRSIEALPSVVAAIPSMTEAYILTPYSGNKINSIASVLKHHGYHTSFFHGGHKTSMGFAAFMNIAGFDHTYGKEDFNNDEYFDGTWGIYDEEFMQYWANELNKFDTPFCSTLFTVSSHHPYKFPERYKSKFAEGSLPIHKAVRYTDFALSRFFETASKMPWYDNTVFVITADHVATYSYYEEYMNPDGAFSVPIVFFTPDSSLKGLRSTLIEQTDIFPSLINYLGYADTLLVFGQSVFTDGDENFTVNLYRGWYQAYYKDYVLQFDGRKTVGFYNYKKDRAFKNNLLGSDTAMEQKMENKLKAYLQQYAYRVRDNKMTP